MNNKFYVSLKAARLLKEKGYNEETEYTIDNNGRMWLGEYRDECDFPCPTKSEAIDWLEESKGVIIEVLQDYRGIWLYVIKISEVGSYVSESDGNVFLTRLQAEEAAIIKALELYERRRSI